MSCRHDKDQFVRVPKGTPHEIVNAHIYSPKLESTDVVPLP